MILRWWWNLKLTQNHPREGFWKYYYRLRNRGKKINHKRLHRIYKEMKLPLRRKVKKRLPARVKSPGGAGIYSHMEYWFYERCSLQRKKFRSFNVIDDYNREILHIEADYSLKSSRGDSDSEPSGEPLRKAWENTWWIMESNQCLTLYRVFCILLLSIYALLWNYAELKKSLNSAF